MAGRIGVAVRQASCRYQRERVEADQGRARRLYGTYAYRRSTDRRRALTDVDRLNLHNKSPQAVEIANKQLAAYCAVTGVFAFNATEELHNKPFVVEIGPRKDTRNKAKSRRCSI
jgi:hypothetical protein